MARRRNLQPALAWLKRGKADPWAYLRGLGAAASALAEERPCDPRVALWWLTDASRRFPRRPRRRPPRAEERAVRVFLDGLRAMIGGKPLVLDVPPPPPALLLH